MMQAKLYKGLSSRVTKQLSNLSGLDSVISSHVSSEYQLSCYAMHLVRLYSIHDICCKINNDKRISTRLLVMYPRSQRLFKELIDRANQGTTGFSHIRDLV